MRRQWKFRTMNRILMVLILCSVALSGAFIAQPQQVSAQTSGAVELIGAVQALTSTTITVNQQVISTSGAEISVPLQIGTVVKVAGTLNADGSISARQVKPVTAGVLPGEAELIGVLTSYSGATMLVNGQTVDVTNARITAGFVIGQLVKVHAAATGLGTWIAREVAPYTPAAGGVPPVNPNEIEVIGTLDAIGATFIIVGGQQFNISGAQIKDPLVVGVRVKVHATLVDGVLFAREVELGFGDDDDGFGDDNGNSNGNSNANSNQNANGNDNSNSNANGSSNDNTGAQPAITLEQAIATVLRVYPNATITRIRLQARGDGRLVWEVRTAQGIRMTIDAQSGAILSIDQRGRGGDDDSNGNGNGNRNGNGNGNFNSNDDDDDGGGHGNGNSNSNSNNDDDDDD